MSISRKQLEFICYSKHLQLILKCSKITYLHIFTIFHFFHYFKPLELWNRREFGKKITGNFLSINTTNYESMKKIQEINFLGVVEGYWHRLLTRHYYRIEHFYHSSGYQFWHQKWGFTKTFGASRKFYIRLLDLDDFYT